MEEAVRPNAAKPASVEADGASLPRCEHVLELLLTHRGKPLRKLTECWPMIPGACSAIVCARR